MIVLTANPAKSALYQLLPSVEELLRHPAIAPLVHIHEQVMAVDAIREALAGIRKGIAAGRLDSSESIALAIGALPGTVQQQLDSATAFSLQSVINAHGSNSSHKSWPRAAGTIGPEAYSRSSGALPNLEFDIVAGERGKRDIHVDRLFSRLLKQNGVGEVHTVVVNNCATAVMLVLNTLAERGEVIVSRGELV